MLSSRTESLVWYRLEMMQAFVESGLEVYAVGSDPDPAWKDRFGGYGIPYESIRVQRNGTDPLADIRTFLDLSRFLRRTRPDLVFAYQAKTLVYGALASRLHGIRDVHLLVSGIGSVLRRQGSDPLKTVTRFLYRMACRSARTVIFHNVEDRDAFVEDRIVESAKTRVVDGSGVNLEYFRPVPMPEKPAFLYLGRLIKDKGVREYLEASRILKERHPEVRCLLVGPFDTNPTSLREEELRPYVEKGIVEHIDFQEDVRPYLAECTAFVLPSYREGLPKSALEAMAVGRPILTCDSPGCRSVVTDGVNGYLVPVADAQGLAERMEYLVRNPEAGERLACEGRRIVSERYDVRFINRDILGILGIPSAHGRYAS